MPARVPAAGDHGGERVNTYFHGVLLLRVRVVAHGLPGLVR